ncbi:MAG: chloride channel protein [Gammaproteobacteria bacterium]|nr:MAG: chloride channel protein [Gammaproteobacteria bacterium]RLA24213.1 MAG: chloride channel protein [Gammaproteobacteria bacterium]
MFSHFKASARQLFSPNAIKLHLVFWLGAILVGVSVVVLTHGNELASDLFRRIYEQSTWLPFLLAPLGLALTAWLTTTYFKGSERSGVPQVKTALEITGDLSNRSALLSLRIIVGKILLTFLGLLSGASVGFGGPAVHIGAAIMTTLGRLARFPAHYLERGLILAGSAAGFAAMFSAPLAGIVFAIEEMGRSLEEKTSGIVLTAIIFSGVTAFILLDHTTYLGEYITSFNWRENGAAVLICGVFCGSIGALFSNSIITGGKWLTTIEWLTPIKLGLICGFIIALLGLFSDGNSFGTGYQETLEILKHPEAMDPLLPFYKIGSIIMTFFSGIPSGIFVPSLTVGAALGADLANWFPVAPATVMILLGITAYFSGMLQSPLTAFVVVMEMSDAHELLLPLMATAFIAAGTSRLICPTPLYRALCDAYSQHIENSNDKKQDDRK